MPTSLKQPGSQGRKRRKEEEEKHEEDRGTSTSVLVGAVCKLARLLRTRVALFINQ